MMLLLWRNSKASFLMVLVWLLPLLLASFVVTASSTESGSGSVATSTSTIASTIAIAGSSLLRRRATTTLNAYQTKTTATTTTTTVTKATTNDMLQNYQLPQDLSGTLTPTVTTTLDDTTTATSTTAPSPAVTTTTIALPPIFSQPVVPEGTAPGAYGYYCCREGRPKVASMGCLACRTFEGPDANPRKVAAAAAASDGEVVTLLKYTTAEMCVIDQELKEEYWFAHDVALGICTRIVMEQDQEPEQVEDTATKTTTTTTTTTTKSKSNAAEALEWNQNGV